MAFSGVTVSNNIGIITQTLFYLYSRIKQISHHVNIIKNQDFFNERKEMQTQIKEIK